MGTGNVFFNSIARRVMALNCTNNLFKEVLDGNKDIFCQDFCRDKAFMIPNYLDGAQDLGAVEKNKDQIEDEIDALVALSFGITKSELLQIYKVILSTLSKTDSDNARDRANGLSLAFDYCQARGW